MNTKTACFVCVSRSVDIRRRRHVTAFTIVELLVGIGIVLVLAAILIPVIGTARKSAYTVQAASNLRQWGVILQLYANENSRLMPVAYNGPEISSWRYALAPYVDALTRWSLMQDMNVPGRPAALYDSRRYQDDVNYPSCYAMNENTNTLLLNARQWVPMLVVRPANYIVLGDAQFNTAWNSSPSSFRGAEGLDYRQRGDAANVLFLDGHVRTLSRDAVTADLLTPSR